MGAGAARAVRNLDSVEPEQAAALMSVVQAFDTSDPVTEEQLSNLEFFKKRILTASEGSPVNRAGIEDSLSKLTKEDLAKFNQYLRKGTKGHVADDDNDSPDENMSVLSYDDELEASEINSKLALKYKKPLFDDLEVQNLEFSTADGDRAMNSPFHDHKDSTDDDRDSPALLKIHPSSGTTTMNGSTNNSMNASHSHSRHREDSDDSAASGTEAVQTRSRPHPPSSYRHSSEPVAHRHASEYVPSLSGANHAAALGSGYSKGLDFAGRGSDPSMGQLLSANSSSIIGLQKTKVWSYAHNAQLEREVEILQRQLEQLEQLEHEGGQSEKAEVPSNRPAAQGRKRRARAGVSKIFRDDDDDESDLKLEADVQSEGHVKQLSAGLKGKGRQRSNHNSGDLSPRPNRGAMGRALASIEENAAAPIYPTDSGHNVTENDTSVPPSNGPRDRSFLKARRGVGVSSSRLRQGRRSHENAITNSSNLASDDGESPDSEAERAHRERDRDRDRDKAREKEKEKERDREKEREREREKEVASYSIQSDSDNEGGHSKAAYLFPPVDLIQPKEDKKRLLRNLGNRRGGREQEDQSATEGSVDAEEASGPSGGAAVRTGGGWRGRGRGLRINVHKTPDESTATEEAAHVAHVLPKHVTGDDSDAGEAAGGEGGSEKKLAHRPKQNGRHHSRHHHHHSDQKAPVDIPKRAGNSQWTDSLDTRWGEVDFLLRKPITSEEDMLYTIAAAEAGLMFTDQLNEVAKSLQVLRGTLSRWLLPYDNNTRIDEQCSTPHSVVAHMPSSLKGRVSERQVHYLVAGVNSVRKLVRIKIADDNDLDQARRALKTTVDFFKELQDTALAVGLTMFELLELRQK